MGIKEEPEVNFKGTSVRIRTFPDLDFPLLLLLQVLKSSLVDLILEGGGVEVAVLELLGLAQRLLGVPDDLRGLGVLVDEAGNHLPTLIGAWRTERQN